MSDFDGQRRPSASPSDRALWLFLWFFRNVVVFAFFASPVSIALFVLAEGSSNLNLSAVEAVVQRTLFIWMFSLPAGVGLAAAFSAIVVGLLPLVLSGKWLRLAAAVPLMLLALFGASDAIARTIWSPSNIAQTCMFLVCVGAYGWFCAIPPRAVGARARWEAVLANGALAVSLVLPIGLVLLMIVLIAVDLASR